MTLMVKGSGQTCTWASNQAELLVASLPWVPEANFAPLAGRRASAAASCRKRPWPGSDPNVLKLAAPGAGSS